ncbi:DUF1802 family protein [Phormidium sp. CCY1219]|uniref:DUF1802 family protein n=1 Tax=Phormidium sp. CCY1219 TaxID=2886104 RepID=UPI002D1F5051|nr:DUF1802 family protein [Phormidium sp. CCY1219]MEB3827270.1 DUF1802 family protein [Phormidium sp. CCY1219]
MVQTALCLPAPDIEALLCGRTIAVIPRIFLKPGRQFALYPLPSSVNPLPPETYYNPGFVSIAKSTELTQSSADSLSIQAWAKCELCQMVNTPESFEVLSQLTVWSTEGLESHIATHPHIFLAHLRLYRFLQPIQVPNNPVSQKKLGKFIGLPHPLPITDYQPVLSDSTFDRRRDQLENLLPPEHPELEELQGAIAHLALTQPAAQPLDRALQSFLGWTDTSTPQETDPDLTWISTISEVGNSSEGHAFEKLVRRSLLKLGFKGESLDPDSTGGPGGIDLFCEYPYLLVGECKATKTEKVSDGTPAQLIKIGHNHLGKQRYNRAIKLIVAAGELTDYARRTATENEMNVIRPETLQRLVELHANYPGSLDLMQLKQHLQTEPFGLADEKLNNYINSIVDQIKVRSQLVQTVKQLEDPKSKPLPLEIRTHYNAIYAKEPRAKLGENCVKEMLLELSSPLMGYLGRKKDAEGRDRFYYLRDLSLPENLQ